MRFIKINFQSSALFGFVLILGLGLGAIKSHAQDQDKPIPFVVSKLSGAPVDAKKQPIKVGQILKSNDIFYFSGNKDEVLGINAIYGRVLAKANVRNQSSQVRFSDFIVARYTERGVPTQENSSFQTLLDTLSLSIKTELKLAEDVKTSDFVILNVLMDNIENAILINGATLKAFPPKKGTYYLRQKVNHSQKTLAEIEFLNPAELKRDLEFLKNIPDGGDLAKQKVAFLGKVCPHLHEAEKLKLLAGN